MYQVFLYSLMHLAECLVNSSCSINACEINKIYGRCIKNNTYRFFFFLIILTGLQPRSFRHFSGRTSKRYILFKNWDVSVTRFWRIMLGDKSSARYCSKNITSETHNDHKNWAVKVLKVAQPVTKQIWSQADRF